VKYTHRISVPAWITFDLESDNKKPTLAEVRKAAEDYAEAVEIDIDDNHGIANVQYEFFEDDQAGKPINADFGIEDTEENDEEVL